MTATAPYDQHPIVYSDPSIPDDLTPSPPPSLSILHSFLLTQFSRPVYVGRPVTAVVSAPDSSFALFCMHTTHQTKPSILSLPSSNQSIRWR